MGRLPGAAAAIRGGNARSSTVRQRRVEPGGLRHPDGDQPRRRPAGNDNGNILSIVGARSVRRVPQRHVGDRPADGQRRRALGSLQRLDAGADSRSRSRPVPSSVPAQTLRRRRTYTPGTRRAAHRRDLRPVAATARRCIKANYGLFWHNPGVAMASDANPNQPNKTVTYAWNDINGDKRWQPGEEGAVRRATNLAGTIAVDPNIKAAVLARSRRVPRAPAGRHIGIARRLRLQDRRRPVREPTRRRPPSAYTVPFTFVDIGVDGVRGTADDRDPHALRHADRLAANFPINTR